MRDPSPVICVVGPTASGKSELAQRIALHVGGEVLSADSMQIYKGMDIGTGKLLPHERLVPHWGLDLVDPGQPYSAALFQPYARGVFRDVEARGARSVLAGGTGLYVRAAIDDYQFPKGEQVGNEVRARYEDYAREKGSEALWELLFSRDPQSARVIHPNNTRRVVRALELCDEGVSYARQKEQLAELGQAVPAVFVGLAIEPDVLRQRIDRRVDVMMEAGLVDEVTALLNSGFRSGLTAAQAIGYKEIVAALDGECELDQAVEAIKLATRRYAKRQRTWFRRDQRIRWVATEGTCTDKVFDEAMRALLDAPRGLSRI